MIKLLLIEDDQVDQMIFERNIKKCSIDCEVSVSTSIKSALLKIQENAYDMVFCDFNLPDGSALDFLSQKPTEFSKPIIVLTSQGDIRKATESLKKGAYDFVTKDNVSTEAIERIVLNVMRLVREEEARLVLQKELDENNANTQAILNNTRDGVWSLDLLGKILTFNKVTADNFDYHFNHTLQTGDLFFEVVPSEHIKLYKALFKKALLGVTSIEVQKYDIGNYSFYLEVACSPILNNKEVTGVIFFARNVSHRIEAEEKLHEAKLIAEQALEFKSRFLANMSHEIRSPMNAMLGFADLLDATPLNAEQKEFVGIIRESGEDLLVIINDILDLSKIQRGKMPIRKQNFKLQDALKKTIQLHRYKAEDRGNTLGLILDKKAPDWLYGDDSRLTQVLNNLISNAIKFTENGTINLEVKPIIVNDKETTLQFMVSDTGIGLPSDKLKHIFEDFTQVDSDLQREAKGTGLGLSIVANLVQLMKGTVEVKSELNKGSSFIVQLKFGIGTEERVDDFESNIDVDFLAGLKILICDDLELNRILVQKILAPLGADLYFAENGEEAVSKVKVHQPDVVFMDLQMPVLDGYSATKILRSFTNVPIIAMTSHLMEEEQEKCMQVGMNGFISKPFKKEILFKLIKNELGFSVKQKERSKGNKWELLNMPTLESIADGNEAFVLSLFSSFLKMVGSKLDAFKKAMNEDDITTIQGLAHVFRSAFVTFDMVELSKLASKIEYTEVSREELDSFVRLVESARTEIEEKSALFA